jgi:hypothetical protein
VKQEYVKSWFLHKLGRYAPLISGAAFPSLVLIF